ncbi:PEP-CTERM sorting domain-containing protein [Rhodopirellula bahusiensis]|uniref:PEP-CTERM sorting domain-containing protein n=1 Tax=Rhodopirellula bahusiensis TaxID=2014065 RepID=UPI003299EB67
MIIHHVHLSIASGRQVNFKVRTRFPAEFKVINYSVNLARLTLLLLFVGPVANFASGAIVQTFTLTSAGGSASGNTLSISLIGLDADGVTFDAIVTATGSANLNQTGTTGVGVSGGSSNLINQSEFVTFTASISNEVGGTVSFDGFTELTLSSLSQTNEQGAISADTVLDIGDTIVSNNGPHSLSMLPSFSLLGTDNAGTNSSFRALNVDAQFSGTATAVPEPATFLALLLVAPSIAYRKRFR